MTVVTSWSCLFLETSVSLQGLAHNVSQGFSTVFHPQICTSAERGIAFVMNERQAGVTSCAIAQMKPAISRAIAVFATTGGLPDPTRCL